MAVKEKTLKEYEIGELDQYLFGQGTHYEIYKKLGAHLVNDGKNDGTYFAVWAPHAKSVSVIGEFNNWDSKACPMERNDPLGIYTIDLKVTCIIACTSSRLRIDG